MWYTRKGPSVAFMGKTGTGKSATISRLFRVELVSDHALPCTMEPTIVPGAVFREGASDATRTYRVIDLPGFAETIEADAQHWKHFRKIVPKADVLIWLTAADTRAYKQDELVLMELLKIGGFKPKLIMAINKVDRLGVDPGENGFDELTGVPSRSHQARIVEKEEEVYSLFEPIARGRVGLGRNRVIAYSALSGWGIPVLQTAVEECTE